MSENITEGILDIDEMLNKFSKLIGNEYEELLIEMRDKAAEALAIYYEELRDEQDDINND